MAKLKNNKTVLYVVIGVVVLVILAGAYVFLKGGSTSLPTPASLVSGASMKCEYDVEGRHVVAYVKGEQFRSDTTGGEEGPMSAIFKENTSWSWNNDTKKGYMMKFEETEEQATPPAEGEVESEDEFRDEIEAYKDSCKNQSVSDSLFEAPSDVQFQDYSQMIQQSQEMMQQGTQEAQEGQDLIQQYQDYLPQQ